MDRVSPSRLSRAQFHGLSPSMSYHTPSLSLDDADRSPASQASHTLLGDDLPSMDHGCDTTLTSPVQGDFSYTPVYATPGASVQAQTSAPYYGVTPTFDIVPSNANAGALIFEPHVSLEQELASFASPDMSCLSQPQELDGQGFFDSAVSSASPPATLGPMLSLLLADDVDPSLEWYPSNGQDLRSTLSLPSPAPYNAPTPEDFSPGTYNDWTIYDIDSFTPSTDITQSPASANDVWSDGENSAAVLYDEHVDHSFESSEYPADWTQRWSQA
ncbi:hypothetical protein C8Q70DRAFT_527472 [Cubamyces menziesii]|nr:hypothetical protein C8Q70DRAFT_527472 [Cubamyces menziesii]